MNGEENAPASAAVGDRGGIRAAALRRSLHAGLKRQCRRQAQRRRRSLGDVHHRFVYRARVNRLATSRVRERCAGIYAMNVRQQKGENLFHR